MNVRDVRALASRQDNCAEPSQLQRSVRLAESLAVTASPPAPQALSGLLIPLRAFTPRVPPCTFSARKSPTQSLLERTPA